MTTRRRSNTVATEGDPNAPRHCNICGIRYFRRALLAIWVEDREGNPLRETYRICVPCQNYGWDTELSKLAKAARRSTSKKVRER